MLYDVQLAEAKAEEDEFERVESERRERLNLVVQVLTGLTIISVVVDSHSFVWTGAEEKPDGLGMRTFVLVLLVFSIVLVLSLLARSSSKPLRVARGGSVETNSDTSKTTGRDGSFIPPPAHSGTRSKPAEQPAQESKAG